jgi:hypothetical protein
LLPRIGDVPVDGPAASPVGHRAPVRRRLEHVDGLGIEHALAAALDARRHALTGDRVPDEDDLPLVPREHPAAGGRLLDLEREHRAGLDHSKASTGSFARSRIRRSTHAACDWA